MRVITESKNTYLKKSTPCTWIIPLYQYVAIPDTHRMYMGQKPEKQILYTLLGHNTENSKQIFPENVLRALSPNSYIHVSVSDLHIPTIGLPILLQENVWTDPGNIWIAHSHIKEIGTEAAQFLFWEYIKGIFRCSAYLKY